VVGDVELSSGPVAASLVHRILRGPMVLPVSPTVTERRRLEP
jgi:hypothetical protein